MWLAQLSWWLQQGLMIWLFALAALIAYRFVTDLGHLSGLLSGDGAPGSVDPERVQLAIALPAALATYIGQGVQAVEQARDGAVIAMPEPHPVLLGVFAGSQVIYLAGKVLRSLRP